jgi:hypothetical protein
MTEAAIAEKPPAQSDNDLLINPSNVICQVAGQAYRQWFVRLPEAWTADHIKELRHWRLVQARPSTALKPLDEVRLVAFEESWIADCIVSDASAAGVVFCKPKITILETGRFDRLPQDGTHQVFWTGTGYAVRRMHGSQAQMTPIVRTVELATRDMKNLFPQKVKGKF